MTVADLTPHSFVQSERRYHRDGGTGVYIPEGRGEFRYNDGDQVEEAIHRIVEGANDISCGSDELVAHIADWPTLYHLSPERANLMRPLERLLKGRRVLELGSGCGAISRYLGELGCELTCVEGSHRRARITASRCRDLPNVRVFNDNFQDFRDDVGYDVVTFIGVLEYSRTFLDGPDPVAKALALARSFLKPGGQVVIAIENKLGLKYFAGAPEDHLGQPYAGLHDLYDERSAVTFGRHELAQVLADAGFVRSHFLYPYPDYKLPTLVLTEAALRQPTSLLRNLVSACHAPDQAQTYTRSFSEAAALQSLADNRLLGELANSFLVVADTDAACAAQQQVAGEDLAFVYSQGRKKAFSKTVSIHREANGALMVRRQLQHTGELPMGMQFPAQEPWLPGESLFNRLLRVVNRPGWGEQALAAWLEPLADALAREAQGEPPCLPGRYLDATPSNFLVDAEGHGQFIDLEWELEDRVDLDGVLWRGVYHSLKKAGTLASPARGTPLRPDLLSAEVVFRLTGRRPDVPALLHREQALQALVSNNPAELDDMRHELPVRDTPRLGPTARRALAAQATRRDAADLRLAVVLHLFYPEYWPEFVDALRRLPAHTDVFITSPAEKLEWVRKAVATDLPSAKVVVSENRGRDVGPLVELLRSVRLEAYDYVLKLHTKRSPHLQAGQGERWRASLLNGLLPVGRIAELLAHFEAHPELGMAAPARWLQPFDATTDANLAKLQPIAQRLGIDVGTVPFAFPVGTMFWARGEVFAPLRELALTSTDFDPEQGQLDGTLAHAMERAMPLLALRAGLQVQAMPNDLYTEEELSGGRMSLEQWLQARCLSPRQEQTLARRLAEATVPRLQVVVLNLRTASAGLSTTLASLATAMRAGLPVDVQVLGAPMAPSIQAPFPLQTLDADATEWAGVFNGAVSQAQSDWVLLLRAGDELTPDGLALTLLTMRDDDHCVGVYADEVFREAGGALGAAFRPDMNLDLLLSFPASLCGHWLWRRSHLIEMGGLDAQRGDAAELDLILRTVEAGGLPRLGHVAEPLVVTDAPSGRRSAQERQAVQDHLLRRGYVQAVVEETAPRLYRVHYGHQDQPLVSVIVPTRDQLDMVRRCVESLLEKTRYANYEILIVDNQSADPAAVAWLDGIEAMGDERIRVVRYPHPFNYSAMNNLAVQQARGEYLVLLNNDTAIIDGQWMGALLNHAQRPEVGAVGAKLLFPDGRIQHAGVVLGLRGPAEHPFIGQPMDAPGVMQRLRVDQNYTAVTAACLMVRKEAYLAVGGLDEADFKVSYNDIDFCLKLVQAGYLNVWTPHALVMHEGSVSQNAALQQVDPKAQQAKRERFLAEQDALYAKWMPAIARDPAYNANLSLQGNSFSFEARVDLVRPRGVLRDAPVVLAHAADRSGCGHYRVIQPLEALRQAGLAEGFVNDTALLPSELARFDPDAIVLQRQIGDERLEAMRRMKAFSRAFKVYELDDYLPSLPARSAMRDGIPKDAVKQLRKGLSLVDRFVVSTDALAEAFDGLHPDTRVVKNRLPAHWWANLGQRRRDGRKPRVGWAGGSGHAGDLAILSDVVKALADEVEWVFFGMCPPGLLSLVSELHTGVAIEQYPAKLAALDLDLALAPLEHNRFNECKSNLRLLEYGACGFPVVASDIRCYREDGLPVTLVRNRFKDWVDAIRSHVHDLDASRQAGLQLQAAVTRDWMLQGDALQQWRQAWSQP
ncbi:rhamnan synthesis F family protein [Hydrogenophaga sp.]|uniref:rhamnan synthesis F family protein n=1 Tax=Hydrogenophaga sp. TaxID=1904254 RepID=UPI0039190872